jgi:hypothetical protein
MFRSATLLILLAFLLGLWIGFNPDARARAVEAGKRADVALTNLGTELKASIDHLFNRVSQESPPPANPPIEPKPSNVLGQIEAALQQIWNALVKLWHDLVNSSPAPASKDGA